jgi:gluconokinase
MAKGLVIVIMGVSGSGKTTVGKLIAQRIHFPFVDGDDLHSKANKEKMRAGLPLTDADRLPWLETLSDMISRWLAGRERIVLACSALEESYRRVLIKDPASTPIIFLKGSFELITKRLAQRKGHFFNRDLLPSQFAILEEPKDAIILDASETPDAIVKQACQRLRQYLGK